MDYDADGTLDLISGSYDPGDLYLFRGLGDGEYAARENLLDTAGQPVVHHPEEFAKWQRLQGDPEADRDVTIRARVASFGSWPAMVDWDGDGDLDLLIGSFAGRLYRRVNEGSREEPVWGTESIPVEAAGEPIAVGSHANPVVADWDGDGRWDLVVSAGDGSVGWYPNTGDADAPALGARRALVAAKSRNKFLQQYVEPDEVPGPGVRAQICVADYDGDGALDLLLGDYRDDVVPLRELDADERAAFDALLAEEAELQELLWSADDEEEEERLGAQYEELQQRKKAYLAGGDHEPRRSSFVWLYPRRPRAAGAARAIEAGAVLEPTGPVAVAAYLAPSGTVPGAVTLSVELLIEDGWHVYGEVSPNSPYPSTAVGLRLPEGVEALGEWRRPEGHPAADDPGTEELDGLVVFSRDLRVDPALGELSLGVEVSYQVCDEDLCLPPATDALTLEWSGGPTPEERVAALRQEHRESELGYRESYRAFEPRFAALAEEHRGTEAEVSARLWLLQQTWWLREDGKMESTALPIAEDLLERHFDSPRLGDLVESHYVFDGDAKVELFERLLESPHGAVSYTHLTLPTIYSV